MWTSILSVIVVINELMASNAGSVMSPATNFDSWVEFYNPSDQNVNLAGMYLCDDAEHTWQMPSNIGTVPAKGYKVVWLGSNDIKSNQAPFKLDCDGGVITLKDKNGTVVDNLQYPSSMSRTAYARTTLHLHPKHRMLRLSLPASALKHPLLTKAAPSSRIP